MLICDEERSREGRIVCECAIDGLAGAQLDPCQEIRGWLWSTAYGLWRRRGRDGDDGGSCNDRSVARPIEAAPTECDGTDQRGRDDCNPRVIREAGYQAGEESEESTCNERQADSDPCCRECRGLHAGHRHRSAAHAR